MNLLEFIALLVGGYSIYNVGKIVGRHEAEKVMRQLKNQRHRNQGQRRTTDVRENNPPE